MLGLGGNLESSARSAGQQRGQEHSHHSPLAGWGFSGVVGQPGHGLFWALPEAAMVHPHSGHSQWWTCRSSLVGKVGHGRQPLAPKEALPAAPLASCTPAWRERLSGWAELGLLLGQGSSSLTPCGQTTELFQVVLDLPLFRLPTQAPDSCRNSREHQIGALCCWENIAPLFHHKDCCNSWPPKPLINSNLNYHQNKRQKVREKDKGGDTAPQLGGMARAL